MVVDQTIWKIEPEKITLFFITQGGHGKPLINAFQHVAPEVVERLKENVKADNTMHRVFSFHKEHYVFVIYKKHYLTRDTVENIRTAFKKVREEYPDQIIKLPRENDTIFAALKEEPNVQFYTKLKGPLVWLLTKYII